MVLYSVILGAASLDCFMQAAFLAQNQSLNV